MKKLVVFDLDFTGWSRLGICIASRSSCRIAAVGIGGPLYMNKASKVVKSVAPAEPRSAIEFPRLPFAERLRRLQESNLEQRLLEQQRDSEKATDISPDIWDRVLRVKASNCSP